MYAVYNYKPGSTLAQVAADVFAILTGTTDITSLSASCVQANTSIISTAAAGWTTYDATPGTANSQVLQAPNQDGSTFKYAYLNFSSTTALSLSVYEAWNAATHAGTNSAGTAATWTTDMINGGALYIYATSKNLLLVSYASATYSAAAGVFEFTRDTVSPNTTYPCAALMSSGAAFGYYNAGFTGQIPRTKNYAAAGDSTAVKVMIGPITGLHLFSSASFSGNHSYRDASDNLKLCTYAVGITLYVASYSMWVGRCYDVRAAGAASFAPLDEIVYNGQHYVAFVFITNSNASTAAALLIPKA